MTVKEFVEKFINSTDKKKTCEKHVLPDKYVKYEEKIGICTSIIENTSYTKVGEDKVYNRKTPAQYLQFSLQMINLYTDIEIDFNNALEDFNLLDRYDAIDYLMAAIPEAEFNKFQILLDMIKDDAYENNRSFVGYIDNFVQPFKAILNNEALMNKIQEMLPTEE